MNECRFCAGKKIGAEYVGPGIRTMRTKFQMLFGKTDDEDLDGIRLVEGEYMAFDNSSGEYAEQMVKIHYCPLCGAKIPPEEG